VEEEWVRTTGAGDVGVFAHALQLAEEARVDGRRCGSLAALLGLLGGLGPQLGLRLCARRYPVLHLICTRSHASNEICHIKKKNKYFHDIFWYIRNIYLYIFIYGEELTFIDVLLFVVVRHEHQRAAKVEGGRSSGGGVVLGRGFHCGLCVVGVVYRCGAVFSSSPLFVVFCSLTPALGQVGADTFGASFSLISFFATTARVKRAGGGCRTARASHWLPSLHSSCLFDVTFHYMTFSPSGLSSSVHSLLLVL
jgi:hypothetical protein